VIKESDIVKLSNAYIEKKSDLSFIARKLFISIAYQIQKLGIKEAGDLEFSAEELNELVGINLRKPQTFIDAFSELREKTIVLKDDKGRQTKIFGVVDQALMDEKMVRMKVNELAFPHIQHLTKFFTKLQAQDVLLIEHKASLVIYKLLRQYLNTKHRIRTIKIEELKKILGVSNKYKIFSNFRREVLDIAKAELKEKCSVYFDYELIKIGRVYDKIKFIIKERITNTTDYKKIYTEEKESAITELYSKPTAEMVQAYDEIYGVDPDTRLFNFNADGSPKEILFKSIISLHFLKFPKFEEWKKDYMRRN